MSKRLFPFASASLALLLAVPARAQQLPTLTVPAKGETVNMTLQEGTRSQLSFGSTTSIGTSASLTASEGAQASSKSSLAPASGGALTFRIGYGENDKPSSTTANIENLKAAGSGTADFSGSTINGNNVNGSSGQAQFTGVQSQLSLTLDSSRTEFNSAATTSNVADPLNSSASNGGSGSTTFPSGSGQATTPSTGSTGTASTTTTASTKIANTGGAATINSSTNVDINNTSFTSVFMQAF
jgi:hypothetical protein